MAIMTTSHFLTAAVILSALVNAVLAVEMKHPRRGVIDNRLPSRWSRNDELSRRRLGTKDGYSGSFQDDYVSFDDDQHDDDDDDNNDNNECPEDERFPVATMTNTVSSLEQQPRVLCDILKTFDIMGMDENMNWSNLCEAYEIVDSYLCPVEDELEAICSHAYPQHSAAVKSNYCEPLFKGLDQDVASECVRMCANYVSRSRGNCCDFDCP